MTEYEFTDRIRMVIIPELEERIRRTAQEIRKSCVFTPDYKAGVRDNIWYGIDALKAMLDDFDAMNKALDEAEAAEELNKEGEK